MQTNENTGCVRSWYSIRSTGGKHGAERQRADELGVVAVSVLGEVKRLVGRVMQIDIGVVRKDELDEPKEIFGFRPLPQPQDACAQRSQVLSAGG